VIRRPYTLATAIIIGLLVYGFLVGGTVRKIFRPFWMPAEYYKAHAGGSNPPDDTIRINVLGLPIPLSTLIAAALTLPGMAAFNDLAVWWRRRRRDRLNQCLECGHPIKVWRGRCPRCGERIGPG
jgi:hypothetical protein